MNQSTNNQLTSAAMKKIYLLLITLTYINLIPAQTIQEKLGYPKDAKLVIIHADDVGVSNSQTEASISALENGCVNSASIMVPCPWFPKAAAYAAAHSEADFGLHITLTSEWKYYKWGPITEHSQVSSLLNNQGYFYSTVDSLLQYAKPQEVETEIRNQVKRALLFGINPTHLDAHMFAAIDNINFLKAYLKIGHEFKIPVFIPRSVESSLHIKLDTLTSSKDVIVDYIISMSPEDYKSGAKNFYVSSLQNIKSGLTYFFIHTAYDDEEMKAITEGFTDWGSQWRQQEYNFFSSPECKQLLDKNKIHLVTWKEIRDNITRK